MKNPSWMEAVCTDPAEGAVLFASDMERWSFVPAVVEFWLGMVFLLGLERLIPHLHRGGLVVEKIKSCLGN